MPKNKPVVSQSRTMWVKKGQKLSDGTVAKKGYLAQYGKDTKKVTARVQMEKQTGGVAKGDIQMYKAGKRRTPMMKPDAPAAGKPKAPADRPQGATTNRPAGRPAPAVKAEKKATPPPAAKRPASAMSASEREKMGKGRKGWSEGSRRTGSYTPGAGTGSRRTTSATVSGAVAAGKAAGPRDKRTPAEKAYDAAKSELAAWRRRKLVTPQDIALEKKKRRMVQETLARVKAQGKVK